MYNILANSGKHLCGIRTYMVNTLADINAIPLLPTVALGNTAIVAETSNKYILSRGRIRIPLTRSGSSSGGDSSEVKDEITYEGGDLNVDSTDPDIDYDGGELEQEVN